MKKKHSMLVDLHAAHVNQGFAGIPQESRLLFSALSQSEKIDPVGWIYPTKMGVSGKKLDHLLSQALLLGFAFEVGEKTSSLRAKLLSNLSLIKGIKDVFRIWHKNHQFHPDLDFGIIWRSFFQRSLQVSEYKRLSKKKYVFTNLSWHRKQLSFIPPILDTTDYDFVLCQDARYVRFSPKTTPIIRYHDAVPIFFSDTVAHSRSSKVHYKSVKKCEKNSIFVCDSPVARKELSKISPIAASRAHVISCIVPEMKKTEVTPLEFKGIALSHISGSSLGRNNPEKILSNWMFKDMNGASIPDFIMTLSTIEPRKNHINLIDAWLKLRYLSGNDIKLLIVGSPGWRYESIIQKFKPHVSAGKLLHLEKVSQSMLPFLYSAAKCFVFPSVGEGFGIPPCEAMQCGCPVSISDIEAHRYMAGDSASYFSPYDIDEIVQSLHTILYSEGSSAIRSKMIEKGHQNVKRFSRSNILTQWETLFDELHVTKNCLKQRSI